MVEAGAGRLAAVVAVEPARPAGQVADLGVEASSRVANTSGAEGAEGEGAAIVRLEGAVVRAQRGVVAADVDGEPDRTKRALWLSNYFGKDPYSFPLPCDFAQSSAASCH